jgi:16S rRNA C967 or C1407 C5-methylase (RsmB/RsmF family)
MRRPFCDHHILAFLKQNETSTKPLDLLLSEYLRAHKSIGAHDRRTIGETLYGMTRWKSLIDYFCKPSEDQLTCFRNLDLRGCQNDPSIPEPIRFGVTPFLFNRLKDTYGLEKAKDLCNILNTPAPTTIRANLAKTTRDELIQIFPTGKPCEQAPAGIQFDKRLALFAMPEFKQGLFEVQDEGSQLVAGLVDVKPGQHVLDYCSGSGGKSLCFAPAMKGSGQIYLNDIRPHVLQEARKRMNRAGIQNYQWLNPKMHKKKMDWVLADVPCSGTGTLRRNPDAKWKIDSAMVERLIVEQRQIVKESLEYLKNDRYFVYATCSILPEENQNQVAYILEHFPLTLEKEISLLPKEGGMDGFFAAVFRKKESMVH